MRIDILAATTARRRAIRYALEIGTRHVEREIQVLHPKKFLRQTASLAWDWQSGNGCSEKDVEHAQHEARKETADILVIDDAGTGPSGHPLSSSAETVRLLRIAGGCRIVVAVDTTPRTFDAEHLFGDPDSPADLAVRLADLAVPALWARSPGKRIGHPAYWPEVQSWSARRQRQIQALLDNATQPVTEVLGLSSNAQRALTRRQAGRLAPRNKSIARLGWVAAWMNADATLPVGQRRRIHEQARHGSPWAKWRAQRAQAEAAAAWLDRWVRLELLPVSMPTLCLHEVVEFYPGILHQAGNDPNTWVNAANDTIGVDGAARAGFGLDKEIWHGKDGPGLETARMTKDEWYPTPAFDRKTVNEIAWQWPDDLKPTNGLGFCEARSRYFERSGKTWYRVQPVQQNARMRSLTVRAKGMEPANRIESAGTRTATPTARKRTGRRSSTQSG